MLLAVDTGRTMAGLADAASTKREVAVLAAGIVGQLAMHHGDVVGLVAGPVPQWEVTRPGSVRARQALHVRNTQRVRFVQPSSGDLHLERMLRVIHDGIDADGEPSNLLALLEFIRQRIRRRTIIVLVIDDVELARRRSTSCVASSCSTSALLHDQRPRPHRPDGRRPIAAGGRADDRDRSVPQREP